MHAVPGGPWDREKHLPKGTQDRLNAQYGLDQPLYIQYINWAGAFIQGDFGPSYRYQDRRVNDIVADGFWTTFQLGVMAFILAVVGRHPARDLRRPRSQPWPGLPRDQHLHHRHRHARFRAGHPDDRLLLGPT